MFNRKAGARPCAGELRMSVDGKVESRRVIWMWPASMRSHSSWAHEMGHVFSLDHSSDSSNAPYANPWDVMSGMGSCACREDHTAIAQYPRAGDLEHLGWIDAARVAIVGSERDVTVDLAPLSLPGERGALLVRIPIGQSARYYTVEARARAGYDAHLPGDAVVIHRVDPACPDHPAHLVTHPGEPRTAAAGLWRDGETFVDTPARVAITVEARLGASFRVTVRTGSRAFAVAWAGEPEDASAAAEGWRGGKLLALGLAPGNAMYAAAAQETTLGMSPSIEVAAWREGGLNDDPGAEPQNSPALAADAAGNVTAVWVDWRSGASEIYSARLEAGSDWGANVALSGVGIDAHASPAVAADGQGNAYAAWVAYPTCSRSRREVGAIMAAVRPALGQWQPAVLVARAVHGGVDSRPAIAAAPDGRAYLAWEERSGAEVVHRILGPQRAVVVEHPDPLVRRDEVAARRDHRCHNTPTRGRAQCPSWSKKGVDAAH